MSYAIGLATGLAIANMNQSNNAVDGFGYLCVIVGCIPLALLLLIPSVRDFADSVMEDIGDFIGDHPFASFIIGLPIAVLSAIVLLLIGLFILHLCGINPDTFN